MCSITVREGPAVGGSRRRATESGGRCWLGLALRALDCQACALGFNPRWGQTLQFQLRVPELALVRFVVEDYDATSPNDFVGQFTLPLSSLKQGLWGLVGVERDGGSGPPRPCSLGLPISSKSPP